MDNKNIIQIQHGSEELWPGHGYLWALFGQGHDTPLGYGQYVC